MKKVLVIFFLCLFLSGCSSSYANLDYKSLMKENEFVIVDVRTKEEYEHSHLVDSINIPYDEIDESINVSKEKIIFVYCKSGRRSKIAHDNLINLGYTVYDLGAFSEINLPKE